MPTTYAHDLFGKLLYRELPSSMKEVLKKHTNLYRIGLHGPDIFFYFMIHHNPVFSFGEKMHDESADEFFENGMRLYRRTGNDEILAYLYGFAAHFLLDSTCHPYINRMHREGVISHTLLEKEYDRHLMIRTGKDPLFYRPSDCIVPKKRYAWIIHQVIPEIHTSTVYLSLVHMKWITNSMLPDKRDVKNRLIHNTGKLLGNHGLVGMSEHFMKRMPPEGYEEQLADLDSLFEKALCEAPGYMKELEKLSRQKDVLSERWDLDYGGRRFST